RQALEPIPLMRWKDWMRDNLGLSGGKTLASAQGLNSGQFALASAPNTAQREKAPQLPASRQLQLPEQAEAKPSLVNRSGRVLKRMPATAKE
ncbi:hypothetical protein GGF42_006347, partial [Coemansia sp. RSA 2424]